MQIEQRHTFARPWSVVQKMYSDPAYFEEKYRLLGHSALQVLEHEKKGDQFRIKVAYDQKASIELPSFAKSLLGKSAHVQQEDTWNLKAGVGHIVLEMVGLPVRIGATMKIEKEAAGCTNILLWDLAVKVPLIGGKLEKLLAEEIRQHSVTDLAASRELLKKY